MLHHGSLYGAIMYGGRENYSRLYRSADRNCSIVIAYTAQRCTVISLLA